MSSPRPATRRRILVAARRLLEERGYHDTGLGQIAKASGVSRQAVYLHFGSKSGLLLALVRHVDQSGDLPRLLARVQAAPDALTALDRLAETIAAYDPQINKIAMVFFEAQRIDKEFEAAWRDRMERRRAGMRRVIEGLKRDGILGSGWTVGDATDALWSIASPPVADLLLNTRGWSPTRYARSMKRLFRRAFTSEPR